MRHVQLNIKLHIRFGVIVMTLEQIYIQRVITGNLYIASDEPNQLLKINLKLIINYVMNHTNIVLVLSITALVFLLWNILISEKIIKYLSKQGVKTKLIIARFSMFRYVSQYKKLTTLNEGVAGEHYKPFFITATIFVVLLTSAILSAVLLKLD